MKIDIPYNFELRDYQSNLYTAINQGKYKRAVAVWHRRCGKDKTLVNLTAEQMFKRVGTYYYFFPTYKQGRKILWDGIDRDGFKFMDHLPKDLRVKTNDQEMKIELKNGSIFQIIGTDDIDRIVGTNPVGCIFSEYSIQDPQVWNYIRPILAENGGWAVFNYTPRGENHGYDLYKYAKEDDTWFCELLTVDDTGVISKEVLEQEYKEIKAQNGGDDSLYYQEYYCDFTTPIQGAYYAKQIKSAQEEDRIGFIPYEPNLPVNTYWDLGMGDSTTIWFTQFLGREVRVIDYYETSGEGLKHYAKVLQEKGYVYDEHWGPHDIKVRELGTGKSRLETAKTLGINFKIAPKLSVDDGIEAVRNIFNRVFIDEKKCKRGIACLKNYHHEYDEKNKIYKQSPKHDWSSHGADSFRYMAVSLKDKDTKRLRKKKQFKRKSYNPLLNV